MTIEDALRAHQRVCKAVSPTAIERFAMEVNSPNFVADRCNDDLTLPPEILNGVEFERIELNDLPLWCAYTERMLSGEPLNPVDRHSATVSRTYEEHYARCLEYVDQHGPQTTIDEVRRFQNDITAGVGRHGEQCATTGAGRHFCVSLGDELYELDDTSEQDINTRFMADALSGVAHGCKTIVELGAGYGYGLSRLRPHFPNVKLCGADGSANAVAIARRVFVRPSCDSFHEFGLADPASYGFLEGEEGPLLVFTRHAVEQVKSSAAILNALDKYRDRIGAVVHFEPLFLPEDSSVLGILRRRYLQYQGYNTDLLSTIQGRRDIELLHRRNSVIGRNPLLPLSVLAWRFV